MLLIYILSVFFRNGAFVATVSENICHSGREPGLCCGLHDAASAGVLHSRLEDAPGGSGPAEPALHTSLVVGGRETLMRRDL